MKYIKIKEKDLRQIFGERARKLNTLGIKILPKWQMISKVNQISYGVILDEELFNQSKIQDESITIFDTKEEVNADIDLEYSHYFMITDISALTLDIDLSGGIEAINQQNPNNQYNPLKPLSSQENLRVLLERDMEGIGINRKASYFV